MLAARFGGGPAYWLDPALPDELLITAINLLTEDTDDGIR